MTKGQRIRGLRESAGMTQEELANALKTTKQTIHKYEKDIVTNIPSDRIKQLSKVLSTTPSYILGWSDIKITKIELQFVEKWNQIVHEFAFTDDEMNEITNFANYVISKRRV